MQMFNLPCFPRKMFVSGHYSFLCLLAQFYSCGDRVCSLVSVAVKDVVVMLLSLLLYALMVCTFPR
jgi:hypothetical protein